MTATITGRIVTASGDGAGAVLSLTPSEIPRAAASGDETVVVAAPIHVRADHDGRIKLGVLPGPYRLRLLVDGVDLASRSVTVVDGATYDLAALLGLTTGDDPGGGEERLVVVTEDGLRLLVDDTLVSADGLTYTLPDALGAGLTMIGD